MPTEYWRKAAGRQARRLERRKKGKKKVLATLGYNGLELEHMQTSPCPFRKVNMMVSALNSKPT